VCVCVCVRTCDLDECGVESEDEKRLGQFAQVELQKARHRRNIGDAVQSAGTTLVPNESMSSSEPSRAEWKRQIGREYVCRILS
jgi:hypothetical protein